MINLLDGDVVCFRCSASAEHDELHVAYSRIDQLIERLNFDVGAKDTEVYVGGKGNWRKEIYPEYKANRKDQKRPKHLDECLLYLREQYGATSEDGFEADDLLSIRQHELMDQGIESIITSIDKDMFQIPGNHYQWEIYGTGSTGKEWTKPAVRCFISPLQGLRRFYGQVISGDGADNIPSFDGKMRTSVPKFVQALIDAMNNMDNEEEMFWYCKDLYDNASTDFNSEIAIETLKRNASVLYMLKNREDRWKPPTNLS